MKRRQLHSCTSLSGPSSSSSLAMIKKKVECSTEMFLARQQRQQEGKSDEQLPHEHCKLVDVDDGAAAGDHSDFENLRRENRNTNKYFDHEKKNVGGGDDDSGELGGAAHDASSSPSSSSANNNKSIVVKSKNATSKSISNGDAAAAAASVRCAVLKLSNFARPKIAHASFSSSSSFCGAVEHAADVPLSIANSNVTEFHHQIHRGDDDSTSAAYNRSIVDTATSLVTREAQGGTDNNNTSPPACARNQKIISSAAVDQKAAMKKKPTIATSHHPSTSSKKTIRISRLYFDEDFIHRDTDTNENESSTSERGATMSIIDRQRNNNTMRRSDVRCCDYDGDYYGQSYSCGIQSLCFEFSNPLFPLHI